MMLEKVNRAWLDFAVNQTHAHALERHVLPHPTSIGAKGHDNRIYGITREGYSIDSNDSSSPPQQAL